MNLPALSVRRPVLVSMGTSILLILGIVSFFRLQIDLLPSIELPRSTVVTSYEGASAEVIEQRVTQIVEEIVATVPGITELTSDSQEGRSSVRITFENGTDIDLAAADLISRIDDEISELPEDIERPRVSKFDVDSFPVVLLGVASSIDPIDLNEIIENQLRYRFTRVPGVAQVDPWGGYPREIRVAIYPERIEALGLTLNNVLSAIRSANLDVPAGEIEQGQYEVTLRAPAEFKKLSELERLVVEKRGSEVIRLNQVAEVQDTYEKRRRITRINSDRGVRLAIRKQPGANTVEVASGVLDEVEKINREYPQLTIIPVINQGNFIERSINNVAQSVMYGGSLAILILLAFLRSLRSTFVIALAIPISIIATFALIYFSGFTINLMTLGGLALGVGMMVDNSIVVLENIFRWHKEHDEPAAVAAADGANEVAGAILASTITTLVIFLPVVFIEGVAGLLFRELAYVIVFSLVCSLLISLTVVPMLSAKLLAWGESNVRTGAAIGAGSKPSDSAAKSSFIERLSERAGQGLDSLDSYYKRVLRWALNHAFLVILGSLILFGATLGLGPLIGSEFLPPSDEGEVQVTGQAEVGTRISLLDEMSRRLEKMVLPEVPEAVSSLVSIRGNRISIQISLKPAKERKRSNVDIANDLRRKITGQVPGLKIRTRAPQGQFLLQRILGGNEESLTVEIRGFDLDVAQRLSARVAEKISTIKGITDVEESYERGLPQIEINLDRDKVSDVGLTVREVSDAIKTAFAGTRAGSYRSRGNTYRILVQFKDAEQRSLDEVLNLVLATPSGQTVALRNLVEVKTSRAPQVITRKDQTRQVTVRANVAERDLGSVATDVEEALATIPRPEDFELRLSGSFEEQQKAFNEMIIALALALALVYMVLASQYESLRDPLVVMLSVPLAFTGVLVTLFLTDTTWNLQSGIGCIMLGGIVVNNAILLVDQAGRLLTSGQFADPHEAIAEAGGRRLRPILMTTLTTIMGLAPLLLGVGEGADAQAPLARAVIGGLLVSTLVTLLLIPVVYSLVHGKENGPAR